MNIYTKLIHQDDNINFYNRNMSSRPDNESKRIKVVFLGDRAVGKSSIINRFITGQFEENLQPTVGVDYLGKKIKYKSNDYRI